MTKTDFARSQARSAAGNAPFGERVAAHAHQAPRVEEGVGSNHPAPSNMFPFASLMPGRVCHRQPPRAMPCRAVNRRELARFLAALQD